MPALSGSCSFLLLCRLPLGEDTQHKTDYHSALIVPITILKWRSPEIGYPNLHTHPPHLLTYLFVALPLSLSVSLFVSVFIRLSVCLSLSRTPKRPFPLSLPRSSVFLHPTPHVSVSLSLLAFMLLYVHGGGMTY